jgi:16S rRNA (cytidine1402-2'-O)-methyltransferase
MSDRNRSAGKLYVVATPIGCLEDLTLRALRVLRESDTVLAEDTRRTRILLRHHDISTRMRSFHAHSDEDDVRKIVEAIADGSTFALVSDAGTPVVSDPGGRLVEAVVRGGLRVEAIPGPSALTAALSVAAIPASDVRFVGFLPRSGARRRRAMSRMIEDDAASVLFESPQRLRGTLEELRDALGDRPIAVCRELTKLHEEVLRGSVDTVLAGLADTVRGEITVVVAGAAPSRTEIADEADIGRALDDLASRGLRAKEAARELSRRTGLDAREAYRRVVAHAATYGSG